MYKSEEVEVRASGLEFPPLFYDAPLRTRHYAWKEFE